MGTPWHWIAFNAAVLVALILDLAVFHRRPRPIGLRDAALWSCTWIALSVLFGLGIFRRRGPQPALEFFTGYLIEKALSVDNLFLFLVIFRTFSVDARVQHRLLTWGILGALAMRGAMIAGGAALIGRFNWVLCVLGAFLVYAGGRLLFAGRSGIGPEQNPLFRRVHRMLPLTQEYQGQRLFVRREGRSYLTPLFLVLLVIEVTDVTLACDSIPAVFGVTRDPFIVYTSNVLAILGLRALYFLLVGILGYFRFLNAGVSVVLVFIGAKMLAEPWFHIAARASLGVVGGILAIALLASWLAGPSRWNRGPAKTEDKLRGSFLAGGED
jgi:tellurite resistance protein TerC